MTNENPAATLRLFVAIALPEPVRDQIIRVQHELQRLVPREVVRWTRPEQFHLTLRFLGNVPSDEVEALRQAVGRACRSAPPLSLCAQGIGFFPNPRLPRVIWVGINDNGNRLVDLQKQIEGAARPFSAEPGEKNFAGHITLGRLKNAKPVDVQSLSTRAQSFATYTFGRWTASEVEIIRSELSAQGARYTVLAAIRLGAENA
jgi:2'-5' RNA ligase